jgi:hypothetical protein
MTPCRCTTYADVAVDEFHPEAPATRFLKIKERGTPQWWLHLSVCNECGVHWLQAQEERLNDVYVLRRLSEQEASRILEDCDWPESLGTYEELLEIGKANGHCARYADWQGTVPICIDLVGQRPNIDAATVARLVNLPLPQAQVVLQRARELVEQHGYPYPWSAAA